ncbi:Hypothetical predicted protein [Octopus vulgaris]|uniref:Uncharacterized protein n=1 Tax=Octopus vulgaris TaxID=6645 RepID=A0AA36BR22_OCTVU|nr:Hypothetical predicted protein [Octopus vulgaris]
MGHSRPVVGFSFIAVEVTTREEWTEEGGDGKRRRGGGEKIWEWKENNRNDTPFDALTNAKSFSSDIIRHTSRISCLPVLSPSNFHCDDNDDDDDSVNEEITNET